MKNKACFPLGAKGRCEALSQVPCTFGITMGSDDTCPVSCAALVPLGAK